MPQWEQGSVMLSGRLRAGLPPEVAEGHAVAGVSAHPTKHAPHSGGSIVWAEHEGCSRAHANDIKIEYRPQRRRIFRKERPHGQPR